MKIVVATDFGVVKKNEKYYAKTALADIIRRYYNEFGKLTLCLPIREEASYLPTMNDITDIVESVVPMTRWEALLHKKYKLIESELSNADIIIGRFSSFIAMYVCSIANKCGKKYMAEVMSCAWDAHWNHGVKGKLVAPYMYYGTRHAVKKADYVLYVTEEFLQQRYPNDKLTIGASNVVYEKMNDDVVKKRYDKIAVADKKSLTLMTCAAVNVWYKGQHYVIRAIPFLNKLGIKIKYYCVGAGDQNYLRRVARKCGVEDQVVFTGAVPHDEVFSLLDKCDIYIQPSLQEGLPRALVEAMSRGCPAIGARTGGIPELLPEECVFKRKSVNQIAEIINRMLVGDLRKYADSSFKRAADFQKEKLDNRRNRFFDEMRRDLSEME